MGINHSSGKHKKYVHFRSIRHKNDTNNHEQEIHKEEMSLKYYLPNDNVDIDRLHNVHFFSRYLYQGNFSSPIEQKLIEGAKVLDVA